MNKKMVTLFTATIMALSLVGVTYGLWWKVLYIYGTVDTGDLDAKFVPAEPYSFHMALEGDLCPPEKVTELSVRVYPHAEDDQILYVEVWELYPCIWVKIPIMIENDGTVPWVVNEVMTDLTGFPGEVLIPHLYGIQVDPGKTTGGDIWVHITNDAAENSVYEFSVKIICVQWNEFPYTLPYP